jgi:hypothetical protein
LYEVSFELFLSVWIFGFCLHELFVFPGVYLLLTLFLAMNLRLAYKTCMQKDAEIEKQKTADMRKQLQDQLDGLAPKLAKPKGAAKSTKG